MARPSDVPAAAAAAATMLAIFLCSTGAVAAGDTACDRETMHRCTSPLRVLTDNRDLGFAASRRELARMCPTLMEGMECFDNFTADCLEPHQRSYFLTLYTGTRLVISDLCAEGGYQSEYLLHAPCMRTVQRGYEVCADEYLSQMDRIGPGATDDSGEHSSAHQIRKLCCSFKSYLHCSQQAVVHKCGIGTSNFTKNFLERLAGPLVATHCSGFIHGSEVCRSGAGSVRALLAGWMTVLPASGLLLLLGRLATA
ncbi:uncharacterized protein LOC122389447 [Amphibalanus amphitrite]|nr:uncharacterized protein LOC122389447 [Amphibalanus amphitrite]